MEEDDATTSTEMDVEQPPQTNHNNSFKRFGLKNSIQTNFGEDYVFQIVAKDDWTLMGVSLSTNAVKLYSPVTGQHIGDCRGHTNTINNVSFSTPLSPHVLHSCSSDATIRAWDTRTFKQVSCINAGHGQDVFSFSFGGESENLLAAGCKSQIRFWDWRNQKQVACLEDSHMDDVTQVHFVPNHKNKLVSASEDGLICMFDTSGSINDEDNLDSVINVGTSIGKVGFLGDSYQKLWCLTNIETLSLWDWKDGTNVVNFEDPRSLASDSWNLDHVDYFVDCQYSAESESLWLIGGTNAGTLGYFPVNYGGTGSIGHPEAVLGGGHTDIVRSVLPMSSVKRENSRIFGWSGGEDGRLCCWFSDDSTEINRSWISSTMAIKPSKERKKIRHQPY
ncbi:hypothetical protein ACFE04_016590 [Oxalis oulophora]